MGPRGSGSVLAVVLLAGAPGAARALEEPPPGRAAAEASCARADEAARDLRFEEALAAYRAAIAADPSARCALSARARAEDLEAHAEGGFGPLAELSAVRRDPQKMADRAAIEALARDLEGFPPGRVRVEARLVVAEAWDHRLGEPVRAIAAYEAAVADRGGDKLTRALALSELWALRRQRGEIREALAVVEGEPLLSPAVTAAVRRAMRREWMRAAAVVVLGGLLAIGAASLARLVAKARDVREVPALVVRPFAVAFALYLGGAGAVLVRLHGEGDARPFVWFGLGVLTVAAVARAFRLAVGPRGPAVRAAWAAACVAGVIAAAFLSVERTDPSYLEGLGW